MTLELTDWDEDLPATADEEYQALVRTLKFTDGFGLLFVRCSPSQGQQLINQVKEDISDKNIEVLNLRQPVDNLYQEIAKLNNKQKLDILFISGLEQSFYQYEESKSYSGWDSRDTHSYSWKGVPPVLINLNQQRERFRENFHTCFVFLLPIFAIKYFIQRAPDFFDWRSGLFDFPIDEETLEQESSRILQDADYEKYLALTSEERNQKILEIQELISVGNSIGNNLPELLFELGNLYTAARDYDKAIASYDQAIKFKPDDHEAWNNRGIVLRNLGRNEEAISSYDQAIKIQPDFHPAWNNRGNALYNLGRYEEAIASYDQAIKFKPDDHEAWYNRGIVLGNLGQYEQAIASYDQAIKFKPDYHQAWYNRGIALDDLGRYEEAIASYDQAIKFKPDFHEAWYNKARCYALQGNSEKAIESLQTAININPDECRKWAKDDDDFDRIKNDEQFKKIINY
ncbi:tetratricopeptide repeat protein [Anabaena azotica]|uniref:Tetratricopeptide repeat protein n=1 Tax=Anabaena azotica FACHB-119 TaxID=947527 RepID=A0ABR8D7W8_9NOST|nr:tetratricopeptide repeat protein [Anabaena azotica]MBD2503250.1 tetratricopeptide repeat protein [Anabaena azotica FACHB-119]